MLAFTRFVALARSLFLHLFTSLFIILCMHSLYSLVHSFNIFLHQMIAFTRSFTILSIYYNILLKSFIAALYKNTKLCFDVSSNLIYLLVPLQNLVYLIPFILEYKRANFLYNIPF